MKKWDWKAIFISLILAFTFWIFHALNADHTANIKLPVQMAMSNADSIALVEVIPPPQYINVNVTGYGWTVLRKTFGIGLDVLNIELQNPLNENYVATKSLRTAIDEILNEMKSINYLLEDSIFFDYDTTALKTIQVQLNPDTIDLEEGYRIISDIVIAPSVVHLSGPASELTSYPDTIYLAVEEQRIDDSYEDEINIPIRRNPLINTDYDRINVMFDVGFFVNRQLGVPVSTINFPKGETYQISPLEAKLDFFILETDEIGPEDYLLVLLDFENYVKKDSTISPKVYLPQKMKDVIYSPEQFKVYKK